MAFLFKLKCLNGPLAGREVMLPMGSLKLGGEDPDLVVPLEADGQIVLEVGEDEIHLQTTLPVWINGVLRQDHEAPLPLGVVLDLAGQAIVLGRTEDILNDLTIPPRRKSSLNLSVNGKKLPIALLVILVLIIAVILIGTIITKTRTSSPPATLAWVNAQLATQSGLKGITASQNANQEVILNGYCTQTTQLAHFYSLLVQRGIIYRDQVVCQDMLAHSVRATLESYGYRDVTITFGSNPGDVQLDGNISSDTKWEHAYLQLMQTKGVTSLKVINRDAQIFDSLLTLLQAKVGLEGLSITKEGKHIMVSGSLLSARSAAVRTAISVFNQNQTGDAVRASFQDMPSAVPALPIFPAPIVSYGGGPRDPYIELTNGMRLQRGSVLPSDYILYDVYPSGVSVRKGLRLVFISMRVTGEN